MNNIMDEVIKLVYICYYGKHMGQRLGAILELVREHDGLDFFESYGTSADSIGAFLQKCKAKGITLW